MPVTIVRGQETVTLDQGLHADRPRQRRRRRPARSRPPTRPSTTSTYSIKDQRARRSSSSIRRASSAARSSTATMTSSSRDDPGLRSAERRDRPRSTRRRAATSRCRCSGSRPIAGVGDDTITNFNVPAFDVRRRDLDAPRRRRATATSSSAAAPARTSNSSTRTSPNPARPNNVLAPFWTDLNPGAGGAIRIGTLTDGADAWIVVDWDARSRVQHRVQDPLVRDLDRHQRRRQPGRGHQLRLRHARRATATAASRTVGAENKFGNRGQQHVLSTASARCRPTATQLRVTTTPGTVSSVDRHVRRQGRATKEASRGGTARRSRVTPSSARATRASDGTIH